MDIREEYKQDYLKAERHLKWARKQYERVGTNRALHAWYKAMEDFDIVRTYATAPEPDYYAD